MGAICHLWRVRRLHLPWRLTLLLSHCPLLTLAVLGLSFAQRAQPPFITSQSQKGLDEETYSRLVSQHQPATSAGAPGSLGGNSSSREAELQQAAERYRRETEPKKKAYQETLRRQREESANPKVIDFDSPRGSPFEEKSEVLGPVRKPPAISSASNTLTKVNSLSHRSREKMRSSGHLDALKHLSDPITEEGSSDRGRRRVVGPTPSISQGIGAALANVGKMAGAPATVGGQDSSTQAQTSCALQSVDMNDNGARANSPGGSPRPDFTRAKGHTRFKVADYDKGGDTSMRANAAKQPVNLILDRTKRPDASSVMSPSTASPRMPAFPTRKSYGPEFDFQESKVEFTPSPHSDRDDSDDEPFCNSVGKQVLA